MPHRSFKPWFQDKIRPYLTDFVALPGDKSGDDIPIVPPSRQHEAYNYVAVKFGFSYPSSQLGWAWVVKDGPYRGTMPKRLRSYCRQTDWNVSDSQMADFGEHMRSLCIEQGNRYLRISRTADWDPGYYNDDDSCFWQCRTVAKDMIADYGGCAVEVVEETDDSSIRGGYNTDLGSLGDRHDIVGHGRAWIIPSQDETPILFNAYTFAPQVEGFVSLITETLGLEAKKLPVRNNKKFNGNLWINNGKGWALTNGESLDDNPIELDVPEPDGYACARCGVFLGDPENDNSDRIWADNGLAYCDCCYDEGDDE